jgi:hypothetical protein
VRFAVDLRAADFLAVDLRAVVRFAAAGATVAP